jgi:glycosyltransferase involved in cell wall biosynthesis
LAEELARRGATGPARRLFGRRAARASEVVVAQNEDAAGYLRRARGGPVIVEPNVAVDPHLVSSVSSAVAHGAARARPGPTVVYAGRTVRWKGARLAVEALARPPLADWHLDVYGDGPDTAHLRARAVRLGVGGRAHFHGTRPRDEVLGALAHADALLLPSVNDSAGWVAAEAMALGCPVVCLDRGGPPVLVDEAGGTVVAAQGDVPRALAEAVAHVGGRRAPTMRWSTERLPDLLERWYAAALGPGQAAATASSGAAA